MLCFRCGSYNADHAAKCSVCGQDFVDERGKAVASVRRQSQTATPASIFVPGETVAGRYRIGELIGQGGVGAVYRARDLEIDVDVALKAISPNLLQTEDEQKNFSKQIRAARKLQHPNIVRIYDEGHQASSGGAGGARRFYTMKLLEGLTLRKIIRLRHEKGQAFSKEELVPIFHQLAAALDHAHKTTWHGDLKPENVIILPDLLKVTDFNLVKALPLKPFLGIAKSKSKGFPYIAPELRVEATHIDGRCDVYSLGVILAEMLTGLVYEGHFTRALTAALEQLPTKLDGLVRRALSEHPDGRFPRASEMAKELEAALAAMPDALPAPVVPAGGDKRARSTPPPVPAETNPGVVPADITDEEARAAAPADRNDAEPDEDVDEEAAEVSDELLEIGQSQVVLLESLEHKPDLLAAAARRLLVRSQPDSGDASLEASRTQSGPVGESASDEAKARRGLKAEDLIETLYSDEDDAALIPPPLPDGSGPEVTEDDADKLDLDQRLEGREDDPSSEEITAENLRLRRPGGVADAAPPAAPSSDGDEPPPDEPTREDLRRQEPLPPELRADDDGGIHDELTALKPHPRADLLDEGVQDPFDAATATALKPSEAGEGKGAAPSASDADRDGARPPRLEDEDDDEPSLPPHVVSAASERSSPRLHAARGVPPPVLTPSGPRPAPMPPLRPVAPPAARKKSPAGVYAGVAAGLAAVGVLVFGLVSVFSDEGSGPASADAGAREVAGADPLPGAAPPLVALVADGGPAGAGGGKGEPTTGVADAKLSPAEREALEKKRAEEARQVEEIRRLEEARKLAAAAAARIEAGSPEDRQRLIEEEKKRAEERAIAEAKARAEMDAREAAEREKRLVEEQRLAAEAEKQQQAQQQKQAAEAEQDEAAGDQKVAMVAAECPRGMAMIEGGTFQLGSSPSDPMRNFGEKVSETAEVKAFCMDYYEFPNGARLQPSVNVTWQAAKGLCESKGKRLCSEVEWERACKGPSGYRFPYGNTWDPDACNTVDASGHPRALASAADYKACRSGFRVYALAGNAEEWTADSFQPGASSKTVKGGAADRPDWASRCAARRGLAPKTTGALLGFRCCKDL